MMKNQDDFVNKNYQSNSKVFFKSCHVESILWNVSIYLHILAFLNAEITYQWLSVWLH